jgi:hypothetical protein
MKRYCFAVDIDAYADARARADDVLFNCSVVDVECHCAPRIVDRTSASDGERAVHKSAQQEVAQTILGVQVHDANAGVQQRRNQVQTHVMSENVDARIVVTANLQGGLEFVLRDVYLFP